MTLGMFDMASRVTPDLQQRLNEHVANALGSGARAGLQSMHVTKQDVRSELHWLEVEAGVLSAVALGIAGLIVWSKVR